MKALVIAGGKPQAALIKQLKSRGYEIVLIDRNEKAAAVPYADIFYPISTLDVDGIREIAKKEEVDFLITVCADQVLLVAAQICEELGLPCYIDYETAKNVSSKEYMKRIFVENGVPTSKHIVASELDEAMLEGLEYPLIVKPVDSYSSRGVKRTDNIEEVRSAFKAAVEISRTGTAIVEEFVGGEELSVDVYVEEGIAHVLCCRSLDKVPNSDGFVICRGNYPAPISESVKKGIQETAQKIAEGFKLKNTPMLIQMKVDGERMSVIEFCARTGGGIKYRLLPKVSGFDVVKAVVDLTCGEKPHVEKYEYPRYIIDEFIYCSNGVLDRFEGFEELKAEGIIEEYELYKPEGFEFEGITCSGDRAASFSVEGDTLEELERKHKLAEQRVKALSKDGRDLIRHDIIKTARYL